MKNLGEWQFQNTIKIEELIEYQETKLIMEDLLKVTSDLNKF